MWVFRRLWGSFTCAGGRLCLIEDSSKRGGIGYLCVVCVCVCVCECLCVCDGFYLYICMWSYSCGWACTKCGKPSARSYKECGRLWIDGQTDRYTHAQTHKHTHTHMRERARTHTHLHILAPHIHAYAHTHAHAHTRTDGRHIWAS